MIHYTTIHPVTDDPLYNAIHPVTDDFYTANCIVLPIEAGFHHLLLPPGYHQFVVKQQSLSLDIFYILIWTTSPIFHLLRQYLTYPAIVIDYYNEVSNFSKFQITWY